MKLRWRGLVFSSALVGRGPERQPKELFGPFGCQLARPNTELSSRCSFHRPGLRPIVDYRCTKQQRIHVDAERKSRSVPFIQRCISVLLGRVISTWGDGWRLLSANNNDRNWGVRSYTWHLFCIITAVGFCFLNKNCLGVPFTAKWTAATST